MDDIRVAAVTNQQSTSDQLETLLPKLLAGTAVPAPAQRPEPPTMEQLIQRLLVDTLTRQPVPAAPAVSSGLETLLKTLLSGNPAQTPQPRPGPIRVDWATVVSVSCGKAGHSATRCPALNEAFPFMLLGWKADKEGDGSLRQRRKGTMLPRLLLLTPLPQPMLGYCSRPTLLGWSL